MRYIKIDKTYGVERDITREEAKDLISRYYTEKVRTYDEMLDHEGRIPCLFSIVEVRR